MSEQQTTTAPSSPFAALLGPLASFAAPMMAPFTAASSLLRQSVVDGTARMQTMMDEAAKVEAQGLAHTQSMMAESARLSQEALGYMYGVQTAWRKVALDAVRQAATPDASK